MCTAASLPAGWDPVRRVVTGLKESEWLYVWMGPRSGPWTRPDRPERAVTRGARAWGALSGLLEDVVGCKHPFVLLPCSCMAPADLCLALRGRPGSCVDRCTLVHTIQSPSKPFTPASIDPCSQAGARDAAAPAPVPQPGKPAGTAPGEGTEVPLARHRLGPVPWGACRALRVRRTSSNRARPRHAAWCRGLMRALRPSWQAQLCRTRLDRSSLVATRLSGASTLRASSPSTWSNQRRGWHEKYGTSEPGDEASRSLFGHTKVFISILNYFRDHFPKEASSLSDTRPCPWRAALVQSQQPGFRVPLGSMITR